MRLGASVLICLMVAGSVGAAARVTIAQLEEFLKSRQAAKESDEEIAEQLSKVALAEELTGPALARILADAGSRPRTAEQIELLAAESIFKPAPDAEQPHDPTPDAAAQQQMIEGARAYVNGALRHLPDFLAVRVTHSFDNTITDTRPKHGKPMARMHFIGEHRREIAYRDGREVDLSATGRITASREAMGSGLSTWGEFGGVLKIVLNDAFGGNVAWERWQRNNAGAEVAVFRYLIPEASSHYSLDFCCYQVSKEDPEDLSFHAKPGYHGELFVNPRDGSMARITVEADLKEGDPMKTSAIAVEYGRVEIGGRPFVCPIRSVAITETRNLMMESVDGVGWEKHTNLVDFVNYHKFGSTARILPETK